MILVLEDDQIHLTGARWMKGHCETGQDGRDYADLQHMREYMIKIKA